MSADTLVQMFLAVLLERRVLLRSSQYWLMTVAAEAVCQLLYPFKYQDVYLPVMPYTLVDYLEAPTPFLMGLHTNVPLEPQALEGIVVINLDADSVQGGEVLEVRRRRSRAGGERKSV